MEKILSLVFLFLIGFWFGRMFGLAVLISKQKKAAKQVDYTKLAKLIHFVHEEQHGNMLYWFDKIDSQFLAQGHTREEILEIIKLRYPRHFFCIDQENILISAVTNWQPHAIKKTVP
jgi:hypothetical protein